MEDGKVEGDMLSVEEEDADGTMDILSVQDGRRGHPGVQDADEHNGQMAGSRATSSVSRTDGEDILSVEEWMQWRTRSMATSSASRTDNKVDGDILSVHSSASSSLGVQDR